MANNPSASPAPALSRRPPLPQMASRTSNSNYNNNWCLKVNPTNPKINVRNAAPINLRTAI